MIFDAIKISITADEVQKRLRIKSEQTANDLMAQATPLMSPIAGYKVCYVDQRADDSVVIDGISFTSRVLHKNLSSVGRVFAFVLTLGAALEEEIDKRSDLLEKYYLDAIGNLALRKARVRFEQLLRKKYGLEKIACMSPGSLPDWPVEQQQSLFDLMGSVPSDVDVRLTKSMLMLPCKSVSGLYFPSEVSFFSCQLCPRDRCEGRKAPYNEELAREYGVLENQNKI